MPRVYRLLHRSKLSPQEFMRGNPFPVGTGKLREGEVRKAVQRTGSVPPSGEAGGVPAKTHALKDRPAFRVQFSLEADYRRFKNGVRIVAGSRQGVQDNDGVTGHALKD
ncbi:hypothetical protein THFILI_04690 [Thermus filiformis]|uniref:Uncharacterized protein n=1 Tax=Thermus filiformis TaxID=276 RepID=A0A0D6XA26_THEFI|nr:hypothetical protein THFILI_04690 [Thermus filiformis]